MPELSDKQQRWVLQALRQALITPQGMPLHAARQQPGLFPNQAAAKKAAQWCLEFGLIAPVDEAAEQVKPAPSTLCGITPRGMAYLLRETSPRQVVEHLLRALEQRGGQLSQLIESVQECRTSLDGLRGVIQQLQRQLPSQIPTQPPAPSAGIDGSHGGEASAWSSPRISASAWGSYPIELAEATQVAVVAEPLLQHLEEWQKQHPHADCPLPTLYQHLQQSMPFLTIGLFHDQLRQLQQQGAVQLHPWTGPLTELPEPALAMMAGHAVVFYVRTTPETHG